MSETRTEMLAEIDRDLADIEKAVAALQQQAAQANYPQQVETTTDTLAEIEGQAADYTPPEGWRVLQVGEVLEDEDWIVYTRDGNGCPTMKAGSTVGEHQVGEHQIYIRRIEVEPEPFITPDDVAAEASAGVWDQGKAEQEIAELQAQVAFLKGRELTLGTRLEEEKAVTAKRLQQVEELRSEVSHVQRLWGESRRRVEELETLVKDLRAVNAAQEKAVNSADRDKADLQHRLHVVSAEFGVQLETNNRLQTQLETVKAELVQERLERNQWQNHAQRAETQLVEKISELRNLRIELDALQQAPQAEPVAAVPTSKDDRFEEGWDAGTARAVETIAEWTEPFRTCGSQALALAIMQNLPHIMRSLTGLTGED